MTLLLTGAFAASDHGPRTAEEWIDWRDRQIEHILRPSDFQGSTVIVRQRVAEKCAEAYRTLVPSLPRIEADPALHGEMKNFIAFVGEQRRLAQPGHRLALEVSDAQYWKHARSHVTLPPLLRSDAFLRLLQDPRTYRDAVAMIEERHKDWGVLLFEAQFIKSVDRTTYGRLMVYVPGDERDLWVTFAIATPDQNPPPVPDSVSVVSVVKRGATRAYFMDYARVQGRTGVELTPTAVVPDNPSKNCFDCHKSAVVPVRPEREFAFDARGRLVPADTKRHDELNKRIKEYGSVAFPFQDKSAYGPCLGPATSERRAAIVASVAKAEGLNEASVDRIQKSMDCAKCHADFAPLNFPEPVTTDREVRSMRRNKGIAQTFVEQGWMPPGNDLTPKERQALWRSLATEYHDAGSGQGLLLDWLRGR